MSPDSTAPRAPQRAAVLLSSLRAYQPSEVAWPVALRKGGLVALVLALGALTNNFATAATISIGVLNTGLVYVVTSRAQLARVLLAVSVVTAAVATVSSGVAGTWWAVPILMVLAYIAGALGSAGAAVLNATFMGLVTAVLFTNDPGSWSAALQLGLLVLIGSALQSIVGLAVWRYEREAAVRRAMVSLVSQLRTAIDAGPEDVRAHLDAASAQLKAERLVNSADFGDSEQSLHQQLLEQLSWSRLAITDWLLAARPSSEQRAWVLEQLEAVDQQLRYKIGGHQVGAQTGPPSGLHPHDTHWLAVVRELDAARASARQFHDRRKTATPTTTKQLRGSWQATMRSANVKAAQTLLRPGSIGFRHATRLAVAVGVAEAIALGFNIERGYWIVLTVVMVVKPDFSTTLVRAVLRVVGTTGAVILAGLVLDMTSDPRWLMVMLVAVFAPLTMRWMSVNYAFASFAIGTTVLLLIEAGEPGGVPILLRLQNTLIGAVIAGGAYLLWPAWKSDNLTAVLQRVVDAHQRWTTAVLTAGTGAGGTAAAIRADGQQARDTMLAARPAVEAALIEPHHANCDPTAAMTALDACHRVAMATLSLEVRLRDSADASALAAALTDATGQRHIDDISRYLQQAADVLSADNGEGVPESQRLARRSQAAHAESEEPADGQQPTVDSPDEAAATALGANNEPAAAAPATDEEADIDHILDQLEDAAETTARAAALLRTVS